MKELFCFGILFSVGLTSLAAEKAPEPVARLSIVSVKRDRAGIIAIEAKIEVRAGWFILANPVQNDELKGHEMVVRALSKSPVRKFSVDYPKGELENNGTGQDFSFRVYRGTTLIKVQVEVTGEIQDPITLQVTAHPFDKKAGVSRPVVTLQSIIK